METLIMYHKMELFVGFTCTWWPSGYRHKHKYLSMAKKKDWFISCL